MDKKKIKYLLRKQVLFKGKFLYLAFNIKFDQENVK